MDFVDASGTRYQFAEAVEAPAPSKKATIWPWIVGGLALAGGLAWMASSRSRRPNPISLDLEALVAEARDPNTPFQRLKELAVRAEVDVQRALLDNPNLLPPLEDGSLDTHLLRALAKEFPEEVASHPTFVLHAIIEPTYEMGWVAGEVAQRTHDAELIEQLVQVFGPSNPWMREVVAKNHRTPEGILRILGNKKTESDSSVRMEVVKNKTTPLDVLRILGNQGTEDDWYVRVAVASNPRTPEDVFRILGNEATESKWYVRQAVAWNPNTPLDVLRLLGNEATESELDVRVAVAENPNTPLDTLRLLGNEATESDGSVREAAKKALVERGLP